MLKHEPKVELTDEKLQKLLADREAMTVKAPIDGVVGFRQIDIGNIIHTSDANPLTVLTQITPCVAVFTLPQDDLGPVREAMLRGEPLHAARSDSGRARQHAERSRSPAPTELPFVGREAELERVGFLWDQAARGHGGLVVDGVRHYRETGGAKWKERIAREH